jgi:hypothetical protein
MTKPVTAMAAMILIEEGKIGLDDPVAKYIPAFATMRVATSPETSLASVPAERPITIRMLLTHTSGLTYNIIAKGALLKEYERLGILPAEVSASVEPAMRRTRAPTLAAFADRVAQAPLIAQPGTAWNYSVDLDHPAHDVELLDRAAVAGAPARDQLRLHRRRAGAARSRRDLGLSPAAELPLWRRRAGDVGARL